MASEIARYVSRHERKEQVLCNLAETQRTGVVNVAHPQMYIYIRNIRLSHKTKCGGKARHSNIPSGCMHVLMSAIANCSLH